MKSRSHLKSVLKARIDDIDASSLAAAVVKSKHIVSCGSGAEAPVSPSLRVNSGFRQNAMYFDKINLLKSALIFRLGARSRVAHLRAIAKRA